MAQTVVILGASFTGLKIAHHLVKNTAPLVKGLKVILVSPTTHAYWNIAAPRAIVPGQIPDEKLFSPIEPAFSKYPSSSFEFIIGAAKNVDPTGKNVEVETESGIRTVAYDTLVVTTGSSTGSMPWKVSGSHQQFLNLLHGTQEKVKKAKSIVVGGAGVTGVEIAGELGFEYGKTKEITLISKDDVILGNFLPSPKIGTSALKELQARNVKVIFKKMVVSAETLPSGQTELTLSTGDKIVCDLYLAATGITLNTSFMPKDLLNDRGEIVVDEYMKVKGAKDMWSCGDAAAIQEKKVLHATEQAKSLAANLHSYLTTGATKAPYKPDPKPMGVVTVGRAKGFGQAGSWSLPSFLIMFVKGNTMMVEKLPKVIAGTL